MAPHRPMGSSITQEHSLSAHVINGYMWWHASKYTSFQCLSIDFCFLLVRRGVVPITGDGMRIAIPAVGQEDMAAIPLAG